VRHSPLEPKNDSPAMSLTTGPILPTLLRLALPNVMVKNTGIQE